MFYCFLFSKSKSTHIIIAYLNFFQKSVLCSRARLQTNCPKGNLINRKTIKSGSSAQKYARDCHTLYLFTQVNGSNIEQVFDKQKLNSTDMSKVSVVEVRTVVQSLLQRVTDLETLITSKDKTIEAMSSDVLSLISSKQITTN